MLQVPTSAPPQAPAWGEPRTCTRCRPLLGTLVTIAVEPSATAASAVDSAFAEVGRVHDEMSFHLPTSALRHLNDRGHIEPQIVPRRLRRVLAAALSLARSSRGAFDPVVGAELVTSRHLPASSANAAPIGATWRDVVVAADRRVRFLRPLWLDLGGIAKGYAVDRAIAVLKRSGVRHGVVEAGGDLRVFGGAVTVHLRDPRHPTRISSALVVDDAAVASSGGYFSLVDGASALIRRSDGTRIDRHAATTVIAPRAIWADALTKVALADSTGANFVDLFERLHASARTTSADGSVHLVGSHAATG